MCSIITDRDSSVRVRKVVICVYGVTLCRVPNLLIDCRVFDEYVRPRLIARRGKCQAYLHCYLMRYAAIHGTPQCNLIIIIY